MRPPKLIFTSLALAVVACSDPFPCNRYCWSHKQVWLERVDVPGLGRGVRISGVDRGEASEELLGALGIQDGDVLTHVDGVSVGSDEGIEEVLLELPTAMAWGLVIGRKQRSGWVEVELEIVRGG